jgi:hypothetical protein
LGLESGSPVPIFGLFLLAPADMYVSISLTWMCGTRSVAERVELRARESQWCKVRTRTATAQAPAASSSAAAASDAARRCVGDRGAGSCSDVVAGADGSFSFARKRLTASIDVSVFPPARTASKRKPRTPRRAHRRTVRGEMVEMLECCLTTALIERFCSVANAESMFPVRVSAAHFLAAPSQARPSLDNRSGSDGSRRPAGFCPASHHSHSGQVA